MQFLRLAEKQGATVPIMIGRRLMGTALLFTGDIAQSRVHHDQALALYDPTQHRQLATRFGQDVSVTILSFRSMALWLLGYPDIAVADIVHVLKAAREIGHAATLMYALGVTPWTHLLCGNYAATSAQANELIALADEKGTLFWKAFGMIYKGCALTPTHKNSNAVQMIASGLAAHQLTGATRFVPYWSSCLARAYAETGHFHDAWRSIDEAINDQGKVVRGRGPPNCWRNRT